MNSAAVSTAADLRKLAVLAAPAPDYRYGINIARTQRVSHTRVCCWCGCCCYFSVRSQGGGQPAAPASSKRLAKTRLFSSCFSAAHGEFCATTRSTGRLRRPATVATGAKEHTKVTTHLRIHAKIGVAPKQVGRGRDKPRQRAAERRRVVLCVPHARACRDTEPCARGTNAQPQSLFARGRI